MGGSGFPPAAGVGSVVSPGSLASPPSPPACRSCPPLPPSASRAELLRALSERIHEIESAGGTPGRARASPALSSVHDLLLGRVPAGSLVELVSTADGAGAWTLALLLGRHACDSWKALVVVDPARCFYPPAASRLGIDLTRTILVRPRTGQDAYVAIEQSLRCPAVGAVVAGCQPLRTADARRLQLAGEAGGGLGLLLPPVGTPAVSSFAALRLRIVPVQAKRSTRSLRIEVVRCHGGKDGSSLFCEIDDETGHVRLPSPLAAPAPAPRPARASG